ncbi:hypothetical protein FOZ60_012430 [Perkinsus olseni]|uniref:Integrase catalytic domain-containing protein n=1 Tax=Perkinsus olseni TaxID=32597 RepID=A0A7J6NE83_PEROL|nr:hypothetical protein FOZ60_012430 [Perkinsus olseni]
MSLKIDQVLRRYSGEEDDYGRFDEWLSKFELVSTVQGWDDAKQLELLPLFFERSAFCYYSQLPPADKATKQALVLAMNRGFAPTKADCWKRFQQRRYRPGETARHLHLAPWYLLSSSLMVFLIKSCYCTGSGTAACSDGSGFLLFGCWCWTLEKAYYCYYYESRSFYSVTQDTGSEASLVSTRLVTKLGLSPSVATGSPLCAVTGEPVKCLGTTSSVECSVASRYHMMETVICILFMQLMWSQRAPDFTAWWTTKEKCWTYKWVWADDAERELYDAEIQQWIKNGWMIPYSEKAHGPIGEGGSLPLPVSSGGISWSEVCHNENDFRSVCGSKNVDNYVDDLYVYGPPALVDKVRHRFDQFHLPSKEPESLDSGGVLHWGRRPDISLELPARLTRRAVFSWTGRLTGHYPICCSSTPGWDTLVPAYVERCARELAEKLKGDDPILVQRRLCLIDDLISTCGLSVTVEWVPSCRNLADALTRAPSTWVAYLSRSCMEEDSGGNADADVCVVPEVLVKDEDTTSVKDSPLLVAAIPSTPPPTITSTLQGSDEQLEEVRTVVRLYPPDVLTHRGAALKQLPTGYKKVYPQLQYRDDGVLCRVCKLPPNDLVKAPLCPSSLVQEYVVWCHEAHGHPNWEGTWQCLRREVYFPNMAEKCFEVVSSCPQCQAAAPKRPLVPALTGGGSVIGSGPWTCIAIDTLTLQVADGPVSLLVCYDMFTKYPEVEVLHRKTGTCVTKALLSMFTRWGIPQMVRMDNGSELWNETTRALFQRYTIRVCRGSPGHPQSQGAIERLNRSLLQLLRKVGAECSSMVWSKAEVVLLEVLFYYRTRPSKVTQISPQLAMVGWEPRLHRLNEPEGFYWNLSDWSNHLARQRPVLTDYVDSMLSSSSSNPVPSPPPVIPPGLRPGCEVLLRRSERQNKLLPAYQRGYVVDEVLSPTMLKLRRIDNPNRTLSVHVSSVLPVKGSVVDTDSRAVQPSVPLTGSHAVRPARSVDNDDIEVELDFGGVANDAPQSERDIFDDALSASSALYSDITDHSVGALEPVVAPARVYGDADAPHVLRPRSALRAPSRLDL